MSLWAVPSLSFHRLDILYYVISFEPYRAYNGNRLATFKYSLDARLDRNIIRRVLFPAERARMIYPAHVSLAIPLDAFQLSWRSCRPCCCLQDFRTWPLCVERLRLPNRQGLWILHTLRKQSLSWVRTAQRSPGCA